MTSKGFETRQMATDLKIVTQLTSVTNKDKCKGNY